MKKLILISMAAVMFASCNKNEDLLESEQLEHATETIIAQSSTDIWKDIPVSILVHGGISNDRKYLSSNQTGTAIDLWPNNTGNGRQTWLLDNKGAYYSILVHSGITNSRRYLSSNERGTAIDLWPSDANNGRQKWIIEKKGEDNYYIKVLSGINNSRRFMSSNESGTAIDLWSSDANNGRQVWQIIPAGEWELQSISYSLSPNDIAISEPTFQATGTLANSSSIIQNQSVSYQNKAVESSSFTKTTGLSVTIGASVKVGVPIFQGEINTSITSSNTWSYGTSESKEVSETYNYIVNIPPYSIVDTKFIVDRKKLSANYKAVFKSKINGVLTTVSGRWEGIQATGIYFEIKERGSDRVLFSSKKNL